MRNDMLIPLCVISIFALVLIAAGFSKWIEYRQWVLKNCPPPPRPAPCHHAKLEEVVRGDLKKTEMTVGFLFILRCTECGDVFLRELYIDGQKSEEKQPQ